MKYVNSLHDTEIETLQHLHRYHPSRRARMRAHCILLSHQRYTIPHMARVYQIDRRRISVWIDRWQAWGLVGVYDRPRSGRPPTFTAQEQQRITDYLRDSPKDVKQIVEAMEHETTKRVSTKTIKRYLKKTLCVETHQEITGEITKSQQISPESKAHSPSPTA